jgi:hypothetical protein
VAAPELPPPEVTGEQARRAVADVLSRPEYAELEPNLFERARNAVLDAIGRALDSLTGTGAGTAIGYLVLALLIGVGALLLLRFLQGLRSDVGVDGPLAGGVGRAPAEWLAEAEEHEAAQRHRDAVRCRYRALIAALAAAGLVEEIPGRTAGEYLAAIRTDLPDAAAPFAAATMVFEAAWYGPDDVTSADVAAVRDASARTERSAGVEHLQASRPVGAGTEASP